MTEEIQILQTTPAISHLEWLSQSALSKLIENFATTSQNIEIRKYDGFKDFTRDIQINWKQVRMGTSEKSSGFKQHSDIVVQEYELTPNYNQEEVTQCQQAVQSIYQRLQQVDEHLKANAFQTVDQVFESFIRVIQEYKGNQIKGSPIYWVVEILESESTKMMDTFKKRLAKQIIDQKSQIQQPPPQPTQQSFITNKSEPINQQQEHHSNMARGRSMGRGRPKNLGQMKTEATFPTQPSSQFQAKMPFIPDISNEKKSWEYQYNYEGMDQKMIEQRKRRIALKKMFEDMIISTQQQMNQQPMQTPNPNMKPESVSQSYNGMDNISQQHSYKQQTAFNHPSQNDQMVTPQQNQMMMQQNLNPQIGQHQMNMNYSQIPQMQTSSQPNVGPNSIPPPQMQQFAAPQNQMDSMCQNMITDLPPTPVQQPFMSSQTSHLPQLSQNGHQSQLITPQKVEDFGQQSMQAFDQNGTHEPSAEPNRSNTRSQAQEFSSLSNGQGQIQGASDQNSGSQINLQQQEASMGQSQNSMQQSQQSQRLRNLPKAPPVGSLDDDPEYKNLPESFKNLVDKSNRYLSHFKTFLGVPYENYTQTIDQRLWLLFNNHGVRCQQCQTIVKSEELLAKHQAAYGCSPNADEEQGAATYLSPYRFIRIAGKYVDPLGGQFTTTKPTAIRKHLVNQYTDEQLMPWGYSRDKLYQEYLLLLEKADMEDDQDQEEQTLIGQKRLHSQAMVRDCMDDEEDAFR